jgi:hypothetical protein
MRRLVAVGAVVVSAAFLPTGGVSAQQSQDQQALFTKTLLDDPATTAGVKRLLRTGAGFVDPRSGFVDVTGDGRQDALVLVSTGGAAGSVALYVLSTHGQTGDKTTLKAIFRLQSLYRATLRLSGTTVSVLEPHWSPGDDLCCPRKLRERDYEFVAKTVTFRRKADHLVPFA